MTTIYTLGPQGTFSNLAAVKLLKEQPSQIFYTKTLPHVAQAVIKDPTALGVLPIENSVAGIVGPAQDSLVENEIIIIHELNLPIHYTVVSRVPLEQVEYFYAHPQTFNQVNKFIFQKMPEAEVIFSDSNIHSGELFCNDKNPMTAAFIPSIAASKNEYSSYLKIPDVQDAPNNTTRFVVIKKRPLDYKPDFSMLKTSLYFEFDEDRHSLLFELLREFHVFDINLCRLESRPSKIKPWCYSFFIDFDNNHRSEKCLEALQKMQIHFRILGSYSVIE